MTPSCTDRCFREPGFENLGGMHVVGVLGTMVWDRIWRESDVQARVEEWGGIAYALAAADALGPPCDVRVRPIVRLGQDLAERGYRLLQSLSAIETLDAVSVAEAPNPRVELRYHGPMRRSERIEGRVPPWTWAELDVRLRGCDALYVNFITGEELDLATMQAVRRRFDGPIYGDVHSLLLARGPRGERNLRPLIRWSEWLRCFDVVQVNEGELVALSSHWGDPWAFAAEIVGPAPRALFVTLGSQGAAYVLAPNALPLMGARRAVEAVTPVRSGKVGTESVSDGDPTGCGDVWGMTCFGALLAGEEVEGAMCRANAAAARNVFHRGATGLNRYLRGQIVGE